MPPAGIVGQSILTLVDPSHAAEFSRSLADARGPGRGSPSAMRHSIKTQQGQWRDVITTFFPPTTPATSHNPRETLIVCQTADTEAKIAKQPEFSQLSSGQRVPFVNQNGRRRSSTNPDNVLSVLEPNRSSSWQFELGNLQRENRQLMAEIERIERIKAAAETSGRSMSTSGLGAGHLPKESDLMGPAGPMPPMSCCLNCGSSDVRPDA